ncbi:MAG TPA: SRPBCC family protein [Thermoplasmata archaeon]|nr:SRPBCC family protein [Thermoplasmata archaeon]
MVRIVDDESRFEAPVDRVWALVRAHRHDMPSIHPTCRDVRVEQVAERIGLATWSMEFDGRPVTMASRVVHFPPLGKLIEYLAGPLAGSAEITYLTPEGARTRISVIGEYRSPTYDDAALVRAVDAFHALEFEEDARYLARLP